MAILQTTKEVTSRTDDLTHQAHKEMLIRCVEQLNTLCPILICAMRIFIEILAKGLTKNISLLGQFDFSKREKLLQMAPKAKTRLRRTGTIWCFG